MSRYETRHSLFGVISGVAQPASDLALAVVPPGLFAPEARKGQLYIVAEADQDVGRGRDACQTVIRTIRKAFYEDTSFSVTASLRKAVVAANQALYQQNLSVPAQKRGLVGVTCAVVKDGDLYVAQVAPAQLYLLNDSRMRLIPPSPGLEAGNGGALIRMRALGATLTVEPDLYRAVLFPGDAALLCTTSLASRLEREEILRLLRSGDPQGATEDLAGLCKARGIADAHGVVFGLFAPLSPAARAAPLSRSGLSERGRVAVRTIGSLVSRATGEAALLVRGPTERLRRKRAGTRLGRQEEEAQRLSQLPEQPTHSPNPQPLPRPLDIGESLEEQVGRSREARPQRLSALMARSQQRRVPPSVLLGEPGYGSVAPPERRIDLGDPQPRVTGRPVTPAFDTRSAGPLARLNGYFARANHERRLRRAPPRALPQARRQAGLSYRRESPPFPWVWLLMLVSLVFVLVLYGVTLSNQNQIREIDNTLVLAEDAVREIYQAPDDAAARERLHAAAEAIALVQSTGTITATADGRKRFETLRREYDQALAAIEKVSYLDDIEEVARNPQPGAFFDSVIVPPAPRGITDTAAFTSIYLLDANTGMLYRQSKSGGPVQAILRPQDQIGPLSVGRVLGAAWRFDTIVAVSQSGDGGPYNFYFRNGESWNYSLLAGSEEWGRPGERFRAVNYEGNLYVWGADPGNILRYRSGEYGNYPEPWVQNDGGQKYDSALDLAVDGSLYLLQPDGRVLVFSSNEAGERAYEREIVPTGIEPPVTTVSRFFVTGEPGAGSIFLVDAYNSRIIQIDKQTGAFVQQVKARADSPIQMDHLISVAVDTSAGRPVIYMVNGAQVLRAPLPDVPRPFRETTTGATSVPGAPSPTSAPAATPAPSPTSAP